MKLQGKTAIVTGAGAGMGKAIAKLFADEGARVIVSDMNEKSILDVVKEIQEKGRIAIAVKANVTHQNDIDLLIEKTVKEFGSIDILVNNAGIMDNFKTVEEASDEHWDKILAVNLTGPFKVSRAAIKVMKAQKTGGVIINNASIGGLFGALGGAAYVATKHGLIGLTKNMAATYGLYENIRVNAIAPGAINTEIGKTIDNPSELGMKPISALGTAPAAEADEIATVALFLASNDSKFVNGAVIVADGGWTAR